MKWTLLDSVTRFQGFFRLVEYKYRIDRFDGGEMEFTREVFERGTAAGVLPYDPNTDSIVLVEQFRAGAMGFGESAWLLEMIAGMVEDGEDAAEVVARESVEEAGCEVANIKQIAHYLASPGGSTEAVTACVATCDSTSVAEYAGLENEHEDIRVHVITREAAMGMLDRGEITNALTLIALQWLQYHYEDWKAAGFR
jgi:ADP-ribose pyrophosphatase